MSDLPNPMPLTYYWRQHVNNWKHSCQSQAKFCQANELSYHQFIYLSHKFEGSPGRRQMQHESSSFATVDYRSEVSGGLSLSLPNRRVLRGISADNLAMVHQLLEQLRMIPLLLSRWCWRYSRR